MESHRSVLEEQDDHQCGRSQPDDVHDEARSLQRMAVISHGEGMQAVEGMGMGGVDADGRGWCGRGSTICAC